MNNFRKFEKITIRWIALYPLRTTGPRSSATIDRGLIFSRIQPEQSRSCSKFYYSKWLFVLESHLIIILLYDRHYKISCLRMTLASSNSSKGKACGFCVAGEGFKSG